ncbi:hypothetical protein HY251_11275 [bacterium]|nr:hypothetical protein [bacterium]
MSLADKNRERERQRLEQEKLLSPEERAALEESRRPANLETSTRGAWFAIGVALAVVFASASILELTGLLSHALDRGQRDGLSTQEAASGTIPWFSIFFRVLQVALAAACIGLCVAAVKNARAWRKRKPQ